MPRRRSLWRRFRRATRAPRNAALAAGIWRLTRLLGVLPVPVALGIGAGLGACAHRLLGRPRRLARQHVALALPTLPDPEAQALVRACFRHAGMSFAELALWPRLKRDEDYVTIEGLDVVHAALREGRGLIAVTGHLGNWELLAATLARHVPLTVVARRVNDARFQALILRFRQAAGIEVVLREDRHFQGAVREALSRHRAVALLIDQDTRGAGVWVPFLGRLARTPPGAAMLALRTRAPLVTAFIARRSEGGHHARIARVEVPADRGAGAVTALTALLTAAIEAQLRRHPVEWVWWHERWRHGAEEGRLPLLPHRRVLAVGDHEDQ